MRRSEITGIVLCGGAGRRLGGARKPLLELNGRPLLAEIIHRLKDQVGRILISTGPAEVAAYRGFGCEVVADAQPGEGPLAGLAATLAAVHTPWVFSCPGDAPFLARNLVELLAADAQRAGLAVPDDGRRRQNLFLLLRRERADSLARFFAEGGRAVHLWLDANGVAATDLSAIADSFLNPNRPEEWTALRGAASLPPSVRGTAGRE